MDERSTGQKRGLVTMKTLAFPLKNPGLKLFFLGSLIITLFTVTGCQAKKTGGEDQYNIEVTSDNLKDGVWDDIITNTEYGDNLSPELKWDKVEGAECYAVIMTDPDGNNWLHWLETDISSNEINTGYTTDKNKYIGPYPPNGTHHYRVYVLALKERKEAAGAKFNSGGNDITKIIEELSENDNCLGTGYLEGTYTAK